MAVVPFRDPDSESDEPDDLGGKMSFLEHLDEFRKRLIYSLIALAVGVGIAFFFVDAISDFVMVPLQAVLPEGSRLIYTEPTEFFIYQLKIALMVGLIVASPVVMLQVWLFIAPGLYANEKRFAIPFVIFMTTGLVAGSAFAHYLAFPVMWRYLGGFEDEVVEFAPRIAPTFSLYIRMVLASSLVFQMPTLVFALARMGVVTARWLLKQFKYAVLLSFVVGAIASSPDPVSQVLVAAPTILLYLISIVIAWVFGKRRKPEEPDEDSTP